MNDRNPLTWENLTARVRAVPTSAAPEAPFGYATGLVARWQVQSRPSLLGSASRWTFRAAMGALATACLLAIVLPRRLDPADAVILLNPPAPVALSPTFWPGS